MPDNTKVAVIKACLYEPQVNRTYAEMAAHGFELDMVVDADPTDAPLGSVRSILDHKLDRQAPHPPPANGAPRACAIVENGQDPVEICKQAGLTGAASRTRL